MPGKSKRVGPRPEVPDTELDPMREPSMGRRIWAAYLKAGYNRYTFSAQLGVFYSTLQRSDEGMSTLSLALVCRASLLLGHSMDDVCFGRGGRPAARAQVDASAVVHSDGVERWLRGRNASKAFRVAVMTAVTKLCRPVTVDWLEAFARELETGEGGVEGALDRAMSSELAAQYEAAGGSAVDRSARSFQNRGRQLGPSTAAARVAAAARRKVADARERAPAKPKPERVRAG